MRASSIAKALTERAFRGSGVSRGPAGRDEVLQRRARTGWLRGGHPPGRAVDPGESAVRVPGRTDAVGRPRRPLSRRGRGARVAPVVLPLGLGPRRAVASGRAGEGPRPRAPAWTSRSGGCSPTRAPSALATRFASQWLRLQDVDKIRPDGLFYPFWDRSLSQAMRRETELFFEHLVREDRSVRELITADYSFVNERIARHYGIANVTGDEFRKVTLPPNRRGILGQGSVLLLTSVADRTSPVQRGKWVMQVLLGSPPPPPPPNVPTLEETKDADGARVLSVRERMEIAPQQPGVQLVPQGDRPARPGARELRRDRPLAQLRSRRAGRSDRRAVRRHAGSTVPPGFAPRCCRTKRRCGVSFTENLMTYALGRQLELLRHADCPRHRPRCGPAGLPPVGVHSGRRATARRSG